MEDFDTDLLLLELEIEIAAVKHGRHNQATHGRRTGRRAAFGSAYSAARSGGASVSEARARAREESTAFAQQERAQRQQQRTERLQTRAQYARRASESSQGTEVQRRQSLQRAERLEARIRGEKPPARTTAAPKGGGAGGSAVPKGDALPSQRDMSKRLQEISRIKDPVEQMNALNRLQQDFGFGPGRTEADETTAKVRGRRRGDESVAYGQNMNTPYRLTHRLVEMDELSASNLPDGRVNPNYDQTLQPRDRTRAASQYQVQKMAQGLNPGIIVHDTHRIGDGSPIIDANGNVLSGNGRTLAMQRAIEDHPDRYAEYRKTVEAEALRLGIDPAEVSKMRNPVLVREIAPDVDRAGFAREANQSNTLRMSTMEGAKSDRNLINQGLLADLKVREDQDIDSALKSDDNNIFVQDFLQKIPANERASITRADGTLNMDGLRQIKAAVYTATFDSAAGDRMAESLLESTSPDMKNVQNSIAGSLPGLARVRALVKSDARDATLDITPEIADAVDLIARVRSNPTWTEKVPAAKQLINYLENNRAAGNRGALPSPDVERLALQIDSLRNQPKQLREFFNNYSAAVASQPDMRQADIGTEGLSGRITRQQLFDNVLKLPDIIRVEGEQESLFDL